MQGLLGLRNLANIAHPIEPALTDAGGVSPKPALYLSGFSLRQAQAKAPELAEENGFSIEYSIC